MAKQIREQSAAVATYIQEKSVRVLQYVAAAIAHPHATITEHDKHRALEIIRYTYPDEEIVEYLCSQMNEEDYKAVKAIRNHARNSLTSILTS